MRIFSHGDRAALAATRIIEKAALPLPLPVGTIFRSERHDRVGSRYTAMRARIEEALSLVDFVKSIKREKAS